VKEEPAHHPGRAAEKGDRTQELVNILRGRDAATKKRGEGSEGFQRPARVPNWKSKLSPVLELRRALFHRGHTGGLRPPCRAADSVREKAAKKE